MESILHLHLEKGEFGHGYLLAGDFDTARDLALQCAESLLGGVASKLQAHPDFSHQKYELFGINDSHELKRRAAQKALLGGSKVFIIELFSFSIESANALLKLFEEPFAGIHFFVIVSLAEIVLPTLRSRLTVVDLTSQESSDETGEAKAFLSASPSGRFEMVAKIGKDKEKAVELLNGLEAVLGHRMSKCKGTSDVQAQLIKSLEQIQKAQQYLFNRAPFVKMILEHIALSVPQA
jgi:hypothetical protein